MWLYICSKCGKKIEAERVDQCPKCGANSWLCHWLYDERKQRGQRDKPHQLTLSLAAQLPQEIQEKPKWQERPFRCHKCHEFVRADFTYTGGPDGNWWVGQCPHCGAANRLRKPSWPKELRRKGKMDLIIKGSPEERAEQRQQIMTALSIARKRANTARLRVKEAPGLGRKTSLKNSRRSSLSNRQGR